MTEAAEDLSRFRYHTGAALRRVLPDEPCPVLFRDLGTAAMATYLSGKLTRLAGPLTPLLYVRTVQYREPYVDHEEVGRLVFIRPREIAPWHSGIPEVYVARASRPVAPDAVGYAPPGMALARVAAVAGQVRDAAELREALGGRAHDEARQHALHRLVRLEAELRALEVFADPLRRAFQSRDPRLRARARDAMQRLGIAETDLCTAWHHLPRTRRAELAELLPALDPSRLAGAR